MRRLSLVLKVVASFALVAVFAAPVGAIADFGDVDDGRFYSDAVQWMVSNEITTGTSENCFSPDDPVTRGQAAAFMWRMEEEPGGSAPHSFTDVVAGYQQAPVSWMLANGITTGTSPTTYAPDDPLTRGQLAALLHRLAGEPEASGHPFVDVFAPWQQVPVAWMVAEAITTGTSPTTFSPDDTVTRGQLAAFFYRYQGEPPVVINPFTPVCETSGTTFGPGTFRVGSEIAPGTYRVVPSAACEWSRLDGSGNQIAGGTVFSATIVTIAASDRSFTSSSACGFWSTNLSSGRADLAAPFGHGSWRVGEDIVAGTWTAPGGTNCYWERVDSWSNEVGAIIENDFAEGSPTVTISAGDEGFETTVECGTWTLVG